MFTQKFDRFVCEGDSIETERDGFTIIARIVRDPDYGIDDDDMHNPDQSVTGCTDEQHEALLSARDAWLKDDWFYCGIVLSVSRNGHLIDDHAAALWGIEANYPGSDNSYLTEVANELLDEALESASQSRDKIIEALSA